MSSREAILARIRARQGKRATASDAEREGVRAHIAAHPESARPRGDGDLTARFREQAHKASTTLDEAATLADVPAAVARYLAAARLPLQAVCWAEFETLDWRGAGMAVEARAARDGDPVGITGAFCAIAETGTLVTLSGLRTPATVSLLPDTHIAVLRASRVVRGMEEAWQLLRAEFGAPPRAVNFISGPSRTADIEQTVTLGAHGPFRVHVILLRKA